MLQAIKKAVEHPLLNNQSIAGAKGVLVNITGSKDDLKMSEIGDVMETIHKETSPGARIIYGQAFEDDLAGKIKITIIATGFTGIVEKAVDNSSQEEVNKEDLSIPAWMRKEKKSKRFWEG